MDRDGGRLSLIVGGFVLLALIALGALILSLSAERGIFAERYQLLAYFSDVQGLLPGAPVRLAGKDVGTVQTVTFGRFGTEQPPVKVVLSIDRNVQARIRGSSTATIGTIGLLGDSYVEVSVGTRQTPVLEEGEEIPAVDPIDFDTVVEEGRIALANIAELTGNLNAVVGDFEQRMGSERLVDAVSSFNRSMDSVSAIVKEIETGGGLLHSLIYDSYEGKGVESIEHSLATLEDILVEVKEGEGILHTLVYEEPTEQDVVMQALSAGARLNSILEKINRGEGSLGLLVNDPTLYEELTTLLGGARRSLLVRSLIRLSGGSGDE